MDIVQCYWDKPTEELFLQLQTSRVGLQNREATDRLTASGPNELAKQARYSKAGLFLRQFKSPLILLLIASALLSFWLGERTDAFIILIILLVSAILGFWQEKSAANALQQLLQLVEIKATVLRDGKACEIPVARTVPGDIVQLSAGDTIPGDCRLLEVKDLFTNEAHLTGETFPVEKKCGELSASTPLSQRSNSVFMGTHVTSGAATAVIVRTGEHTEFGAISNRLRQKLPETEFERGIRRFGYLLLEVTMVLVLLIFCINVFLHKPVLDAFLFSLAIAVGLTPQLLPAIISINLSKGASNMVRRSVIVKRLSAIENFGSMDVLCSDKTGTITKGEVALFKALDAGGKEDGTVLRLAALNARFQSGYSNPIDEAIRKFAGDEADDIIRMDEVPYDFTRKRLSVLVKGVDGLTMITKGAFKQIVAVCSFPTDGDRDALLALCDRWSGDGYRLLGVAYKKIERAQPVISKDDEWEMTFSGLLVLTDPLKEHIAQTIADLGCLGIALKIITGDNELVARRVAEDIGIRDPRIVIGPRLADMGLDALSRIAPGVHVFAEVEPSQKEKILLALKQAGHVVGYIGDGINDAPALHAADVGISVSGAADVAKQAADIVLLQTDLNVLADGVREGRRTFANTLKYIFMATSANFGNMFSMAGSSLLLTFLPLLPKQVLLTNLMTDIPEITISTDSVDELMIRSPRRIDLHFIRRFMIVFGLISSIFDYSTFFVLLYLLHAGQAEFRTGWFIESVVTAALIILVVRTSAPFYRSRPGRYLLLSTPAIVGLTLGLPYTGLADLFGFTRLPGHFYPWLGLITLSYVVSAETAKRFFYKRATRDSAPAKFR